MKNWVSDGVTVNQKVLKTLREKNLYQKEATAVEKRFLPLSGERSSTHGTLNEAVFGPETHYST